MALAAHAGGMAALESTARLIMLGSVLASVQTGVVTQGQAPAGLVTNQCKTQQVQRYAMRLITRNALFHATSSPLSLHVGSRASPSRWCAQRWWCRYGVNGCTPLH